jgi:hypothetical protein
MKIKTHLRCVSLPVVSFFLGLVGCEGPPPTVWKTEVRSPDGLWIASADTVQNGGFGNAHIDTVVYLKWTRDSQEPQEILAFSCNGPVPRPYLLDSANAGGTIDLKLNWVTPKHLVVTYDNHPDLYFQVVKTGGIEISAVDLSSDALPDEKSR